MKLLEKIDELADKFVNDYLADTLKGNTGKFIEVIVFHWCVTWLQVRGLMK